MMTSHTYIRTYILPHQQEVENFPGFPHGIMGAELCDKLREQSSKFGTTIHTETVTKVDFSSRPFKLYSESFEGTVWYGIPTTIQSH